MKPMTIEELKKERDWGTKFRVFAEPFLFKMFGIINLEFKVLGNNKTGKNYFVDGDHKWLGIIKVYPQFTGKRLYTIGHTILFDKVISHYMFVERDKNGPFLQESVFLVSREAMRTYMLFNESKVKTYYHQSLYQSKPVLLYNFLKQDLFNLREIAKGEYI